MYSFRRETKINKNTGKSFHIDHFEMMNGERRMLPNGAIQEDVKAGHVEPGMLKDKAFADAYEVFCKSFESSPKTAAVKASVVKEKMLDEK